MGELYPEGRVLSDAELEQSGLVVPEGVTVLTADEARRAYDDRVARTRQAAAQIALSGLRGDR